MASRQRPPAQGRGNQINRNERKEGHCMRNGAICLILLAVAVGGGILLWQFLPEESKDSIQNIFNDTADDADGPIEDVDDTTVEDTPEDVVVEDGTNGDANEGPLTEYVFDQCSDSTNCCNGLDTICDLPANSIMYAGVHNAMASSDEGFRVSPNHHNRVELSLVAGYRAINMDIGKCDGEIKLKHNFCTLGTRDPVEVFTNINTFLTENPSEVILVTLQISSADITLDEIDDVFAQSGNFQSRLYNHTAGEEWPTLRTLVETDKRILFFHYNGPSCRDNPSACPTGFHDWFWTAAETEFSFSSVEEIQNTTASCALTRGRRFPEFFAVNSFVTLPNKASSQIINSREFLENRIQACSDLNRDMYVNVVFIDFWAQGDLPEFTQLYNSAIAEAVSDEPTIAPSIAPSIATSLSPTIAPTGRQSGLRA